MINKRPTGPNLFSSVHNFWMERIFIIIGPKSTFYYTSIGHWVPSFYQVLSNPMQRLQEELTTSQPSTSKDGHRGFPIGPKTKICFCFLSYLIVGIPMGTNCAPLLADIFLYSYEEEFIQSLLSTRRKHLASRFKSTYHTGTSMMFCP